LFDFVSRKKWFFMGSGLVILIGIIALIASGLNLGIEFSSGTTMTLLFKEEVEQGAFQSKLAALNHPEAIIQHSDRETFIIDGLGLDTTEREQLAEELQSSFDTTVRVEEFASTGNATASAGNATLALIIGKTVEPGELSNMLADLGYSGFSIDLDTLDSYMVRTETIYSDEEEQIKQALQDEFGSLSSFDVYSIDPDVATERVHYTTYAMILAAAGILLYITWAFRKLVHPISYGVCAIVALAHDALVVLGIFALFRLEVNSMFVIAILTVIGYSVNNTIVIFDRIRENRRRDVTANFVSVVNASLTETLGRSLNTSLTTLFVLLALLFFGGETISNFILALTIGVIVGTYSSLFIAGQLVVAWEQGELGRFLKRITLRREQG